MSSGELSGRPGGGDDVLTERAHDLGPVEQPCALLGRQPVDDVVVFEDLPERSPTAVLAHDVLRDALLLRRPLKEEREQLRQHAGDCILRLVKQRSRAGRVAERVLDGVDDAGSQERIVFWIERRPGAVWAVGRAVNPNLRRTDDPVAADVIFEGYELEEALDRANEALEDDVRVLETDGRAPSVRPFTRRELLPLLERWFFGR